MKVLVTGFAGYIGPVVVKHLKAAGHYVIGLDTGWFLPDYAEAPVWPDETRWVDIRNATDLLDADVVVHLAGLSNDPLGDLDPALTRMINRWGTLGLVGDYRDARHVIVSSCSVYGHTDEAATEGTPVNPLTAYARAKAEVDEAAPRLADRVVSLRLGTVWGYSPGHRLDLVVNRMMFDAINRVEVTANGTAWRPLIHVEDVARAVVKYVENEEVGIRNIVADNVQIDDLGDLIAEYTGAGFSPNPGNADQRDYSAVSDFDYKHSVFDERDLHDLWVNTQLLPLVGADPTDRYIRLNSLRRLKNLGLLDDNLYRKV